MPLKEGQFAVSKLPPTQQVKQEKAETCTTVLPGWFSAEILASEWVGKEAKETEWWITFTGPWEKNLMTQY